MGAVGGGGDAVIGESLDLVHRELIRALGLDIRDHYTSINLSFGVGRLAEVETERFATKDGQLIVESNELVELLERWSFEPAHRRNVGRYWALRKAGR